MEHKGRYTAAALAAAAAAAAGGAALWASGGDAHPLRICAAAAVVLAAGLPAAWHLGGKYDRLAKTASEDGLTGLLNRGFIQQVFPALAGKASEKRKKMSVSVVDINDFKLINDTCGHKGGDAVLVEIARTLRSCAERGEMIARWGGDEFLYVCPYVDGKAAAAMHARIDAALEQLSLRLGLRIGASVGTAVFPEDGRSLDELVHAADRRMYADKPGGKSYEAREILQA